ncbi:hypothetical protein [Methyloterricola oryzae]|uniref:hypothetical protein n=1 Tax=Methyloterricola oryzae TaxID=1495050 RepID=UPI0011AEE4C3|nr:hypothetical protein [Methyloterricola oryzae]
MPETNGYFSEAFTSKLRYIISVKYLAIQLSLYNKKRTQNVHGITRCCHLADRFISAAKKVYVLKFKELEVKRVNDGQKILGVAEESVARTFMSATRLRRRLSAKYFDIVNTSTDAPHVLPAPSLKLHLRQSIRACGGAGTVEFRFAAATFCAPSVMLGEL